MLIEPWKKAQDHYDIVVTHSDMYQGDTNFVIGSAIKGMGTVLLTHNFRVLDDRTKYECIKTETMHELGHVLGLLPYDRKENVKYSLGKHCTNKCIMR